VASRRAALHCVFMALLAAVLLLANLAPSAAAAPARRDAADFVPLAENANFQLLANESTLAFQVVDKRSGYVWHSNLEEVSDEDRLNRTWTAYATSGVSIDYLDERAVDRRASITNAEHTLDFRRTAQGFEAAVNFVEVGIALLVRVELEADGVRVEVPFESIAEQGRHRLGLLHLYPFFGATREAEVSGYMLIPDGAGSLIRFAETTKARNVFYGRYYGVDLGMVGSLTYDPTFNRAYRLSLPVSGMVHGEGQHAYLAIVEKGAAYGRLQMHPAGVTTRFNFLSTAFIYTESYFQATNRAGAGVTTLQSRPNAFDVSLRYRFLSGSDATYVGLARSYQQYLVDQGQLAAVTGPAGDIGIRLEFLGGEKERVLFWQRFIPMTTVSQMAAILEDLEVRRPEVIYYGWQPLGASAMPPARLRLERGLGGVSELKTLAQSLAESGGSLALYLDPQAALWGESGYSARNDLAQAITGVNLVGGNRNKANYFLTLSALSERYARLSESVIGDLGAGLALDGLGSILYSDFRRGRELERDDAIASYQALLAEHPSRLGFYMPNDYVFGAMQAYYDIPLADSGYLFTSQPVPFLQIVLAGYVPAYGPALNFSADTRADLLRHIDYNVYPSYFLSQAATAEILRTSSNWIFTSAIGQWEAEIEAAYQWLNSLLGPVRGAQIVARQTLGPDVTATTYSNGQQIIVNYGDQPFRAGAVVVNGQDAVLVEAQP
jgi:hypothetical protein